MKLSRNIKFLLDIGEIFSRVSNKYSEKDIEF